MKKTILLILSLLITGCFYVDEMEPEDYQGSIVPSGGTGTVINPTGDITFASLNYKRDHDLTALAGKDIYTLAAYYGKNKNWPTTWYFNSQLPQLTGYGEGLKSEVFKSRNIEDNNENPVYEEGQITADDYMRGLEKELLKVEKSILKNRVPDYPILTAELDINHQRDFYIHAFDEYDRTYKRTTTLLGKSANVYIYVDNDSTDTSTLTSINPSTGNTYIDDYITYFDSLYPLMHNWFGEERDIDNNDRIIIVFSSTIRDGILGYFSPTDKFSGYSYSNVGDIIYLNARPIDMGPAVKITIAHEFQHMIFFDEKYKRGASTTETWINEALSAAAEYFASEEFNIPAKYHKRWMSLGFLNERWHGLSLINWSRNNYGYGGIFIRYLIDQYGPGITKHICSTDLKGIPAIENSTGLDFDLIFTNFTRALVLSGRIDPSHPDYKPEYEFTTIDLATEYDVADDDTYNPIYELGRIKTSHIIDQYGGKAYITPEYYSIRFTKWNLNFGYMNYDGILNSGTYPQLDLTRATVYAFTPGVF